VRRVVWDRTVEILLEHFLALPEIDDDSKVHDEDQHTDDVNLAGLARDQRDAPQGEYGNPDGSHAIDGPHYSSANVHWRNNLMLGENSAPAIFSINTNTNYSSSDYNGFRPNARAAFSFEWNSPRTGTLADYGGLISGGGRGSPSNTSLEARRFSTLTDYSAGTHQDLHSVALDYDVFVNVPRLDAKDLRKVQTVYKAEEFDFGLKSGSAAIDRGVALPNVTDGFAGRAPDLGALEYGQAPPRYGPRR